MNLKFLSFLAIALVTTWTSAFAAPVVMSNPYDVNSTEAFLAGRFDGAPIFVASDFYYDGSYEITDFHWSGAFLTNDFSYLERFKFSIYAQDNNGFPGHTVFSQFYSGTSYITDSGDDLGNRDVYDFSIDLSNPWTAATGNYYFSVVYDFSNSDNLFLWGLSEYQYGADDMYLDLAVSIFDWQIVQKTGDLAWEVTGNRLNVVPEPATMTLFGLGLLGSAFAARRRKQSK